MEGEAVIPGCGEQPVNPITGQAICEVTYETPGAHSITALFSGSRQAIFGASGTGSAIEITAGAVIASPSGTAPASTPVASPAATPKTVQAPTHDTPAPKPRLLEDGAQPLINTQSMSC